MSQCFDDDREVLVFAAATHEVSSQHTLVYRWASAGEVDLWEHTSELIPQELLAERDLPVTLQSAEKPLGTGPFRLEFWVEEKSLLPGARPEWRLIRDQKNGVKVANLRIFGTQSSSGNA